MRIHIEYAAAPPERTERTALVHEEYGIGMSRETVVVVDSLDLEIEPGKIVLVTGPSGGGKSSVVREVKKRLPSVFDAEAATLDDARSVIDQFDCSFEKAQEFLAQAGLSEAFLFLRRPGELSEGQRYRLRFALALASGAEVIAADEFASMLDRETAALLGRRVRRFADSTNVAFVLATAHDDAAGPLEPDVHIIKGLGSDVEVRLQGERDRGDVTDKVVVERGALEDWRRFEAFHYKGANPGAVDAVFVMKLHGRPVGVAVYSYPRKRLRLRNHVTGGRYKGGLTARERVLRLNREVRALSRCVIDPRYRGLGLGAELARRSAERMDFPLIEALAVMGGTNRFLEKAGFRMVGRCRAPRHARKVALYLKRVCGLADEVLHDADALEKFLDERGGNRSLQGMLDGWWKAFSGSRGGGKKRPDNRRLAGALARQASSRPYYFVFFKGKEAAGEDS